MNTAVRSAVADLRKRVRSEENPDVAFGLNTAVKVIERLLSDESGGEADTGAIEQIPGHGRWGTTEEAMRHYGLTRTTLFRWKKLETIPVRQPGGRNGKLMWWLAD